MFDNPVKTFHGFTNVWSFMVTKAGHSCDEIHIIFIFNTYRVDSIKNAEKERNGKSVVLDVTSP